MKSLLFITLYLFTVLLQLTQSAKLFDLLPVWNYDCYSCKTNYPSYNFCNHDGESSVCCPIGSTSYAC